MTDTIKPFSIAVDDAQLDDLRQRLNATRWPDAQTCEGWEQGMPLDYAREMAAYWLEKYDWRRCEATLNSWPQFTAELDGLNIHFIHRRSPHSHALPLIITHGWPGSVIEFHKIIDALAEPEKYGGDAADAFHVVAPSLPGYGFSSKPASTGMSVQNIATVWGKLMARLGYEKWVAQGGDWGSMVTQCIAESEAAHCLGIHINMPIVAPDPETMDQLTPTEQSALEDMAFYNEWDSAYAKQQSTRPQTLGYGLADSPVGQMAWIVEKFYAWTDCEKNGVKHPENALSKDEMLDNVMLYWLNNCAASSGRLYWESFRTPELAPIEMPLGCSVFPREIFRASRRWAEKRYANIIHWNELDRGGHFAAFEQPEMFIAEVRNCFRQLR
ncbi:epoxide hydrolase family protein [Pseudohalioglobus lutimaris]|uniref:Epoxide hydrolase n=1 Tax=Pseudohalioglobus lutimaris TaxID=1737061 RepID=A0A2N5X4I8_9GAMM|nr:epoxide hydrolase family protein [Pseudohalioglobus lutimaris]PLW69393.1 epoxide hydrolase [Pseudohalioglobus lutimaris]